MKFYTVLPIDDLNSTKSEEIVDGVIHTKYSEQKDGFSVIHPTSEQAPSTITVDDARLAKFKSINENIIASKQDYMLYKTYPTKKGNAKSVYFNLQLDEL